MRHVVVVGGGGALAQHVVKEMRELAEVVTPLGRPPWIFQETPIDLLIVMPGKDVSGKVADHDWHTWDVALADNLSSVFNALRCLGPKVRDGGNVVVVGSVMGRIGGYGCAAYAAAKAGLVGLVRSAALEWASRGVVINLLELGYIDCGMGTRLPEKVRERALASIPLKRFATPEEVVNAVAWLGQVRYMTGGVFPLTGGL